MVSDTSGSPGADPLLGRVLAGSYRLEERLGRGAMGTVYRAAHTLLKQSFAVKVLHPELAEDEDLRRRFLQEAQALALFTHKNAVPVRHCGAEQGLVFLAMDLCRGETLESLLARERALPEARAADIALQVLAALEEAHRGGIVHRDLKPANVMIETRPEGGETARVLDFGLARILAQGREGASSRVSSVGEVVGTVAYMSPEQARGEELDGRSDLFALGVMLFEMVEGRHPFLGGTLASVITRVLESDPLAPAPQAPRRASEGLQRVLGHALQKDPAQRYPDAAAFTAALHDVGAGREIARPHDARAAAREAARRQRLLRWGLGVLLAVAVGVAASLVLARCSEDGEASPQEVRAAAERAIAAGSWERAALALEALLARGLATPEDRLRLAEARIALRDPDADRDLSALERLVPGDPRVSVLRGRYWHRVKGDPERALAAYASALARERGSVAAREGRLDLLFDAEQTAWFQGRRDDRLAMAEVDVRGLREVGAPPGRADLYEARLLSARGLLGAPGAAQQLEGALAAARRATAADPLALDGPLEEARVLLHQAGVARAARRPQDSFRLCTQALEATSEALRRRLAHPQHRAQEPREAEVLRLRIATATHVGDAEALAAAARRLQAIEPLEPGALLEQAYTLKTAGSYEEALPLYERLAEIAPGGQLLSDLAFCHQRLALVRLQGGEREAGIALLRRTLSAYERALGFSRAPVIRAYRDETRMLLAAWVPAERRALLDAARQDIDEARARAAEGERPEVSIRRAALLLARGELEEAHEEIGGTVLGRPALNPAFHGRLARCALALGCRALRAGDPFSAASYRQEVLEQWTEAEARSGTLIGRARLLRGQARVLLDPLGIDAEAAVDLAIAADDTVSPVSDWVTEARAWGVLVERRARGSPTQREAADTLLNRRRDELALGREEPTAAFEEGLADLLESSGQPDLATALREVAGRRPPP